MPNFRDAGRRLHVARANALTYAYNTNLVRAEDAPKSALDFLKPMFHGKLISVYPADDDAALYLFHLIVQKYGWSWMDQYMANKPHFVQGHLPVARSVASGEMPHRSTRHHLGVAVQARGQASRWCSRRSTRRRCSR